MAREFEHHDHELCVADALAAAENHCANGGVQFTPVRRRVLEILLEEHRALGAYDVLDRLKEDGLGSQPPAAYRALDFLVKNGLAHRIERLNAFVACTHGPTDHVPAFLICETCNAVAETVSQTALGALDESASKAGFEISQVVVEARGICAPCRDEAGA
ncbi:MAG: transcriptional repressor [Pseudomonadota bacterium]